MKIENIVGVVFVKKREYVFCCIDFSDERKDIIRRQLAGIFYGSANYAPNIIKAMRSQVEMKSWFIKCDIFLKCK